MIQDLISDFEAQLYYSIRDIKAFAILETTDWGGNSKVEIKPNLERKLF